MHGTTVKILKLNSYASHLRRDEDVTTLVFPVI
jgi:hypothetical protein